MSKINTHYLGVYYPVTNAGQTSGSIDSAAIFQTQRKCSRRGENDTSFPLYTTGEPTATLLEAHCAREHSALISYKSTVFHLHTQEEGKHNQPHQTK